MPAKRRTDLSEHPSAGYPQYKGILFPNTKENTMSPSKKNLLIIAFLMSVLLSCISIFAFLMVSTDYDAIFNNPADIREHVLIPDTEMEADEWWRSKLDLPIANTSYRQIEGFYYQIGDDGVISTRDNCYIPDYSSQGKGVLYVNGVEIPANYSKYERHGDNIENLGTVSRSEEPLTSSNIRQADREILVFMGLMMAIVVFMGLSAFLVIYIDRLYGKSEIGFNLNPDLKEKVQIEHRFLAVELPSSSASFLVLAVINGMVPVEGAQ